MPPLYSTQFDIAAVIVMVVTLASLILRHMTRGATNRVYLTSMVLVLVTALASLFGGLYDALVMPGLVESGQVSAGQPPAGRDAFTLLYYALRTLTAPVYLVLIATVSGTTHRLNDSASTRFFLWVPMTAVLVLVLTNPIHQLVYHYVDGIPVHGPLIWVLYFSTAYYSLVGITWLARWRTIFGRAEFYALLLLYPIVFSSIVLEYAFPALRIEMFVTSVAMMLLSAFVIRPEKRIDSHVGAANLDAYRDMCNRAFVTDKQQCLVYLEIVNLEQLRELVGNEELQDAVREVAANLQTKLERDDVLYYLRNGLFCIAPRNPDPEHALKIAWKAHEEGRARSDAKRERAVLAQMRTCVVRVPEDVRDFDTLKAFVRRFAHLVPTSTVTTFSELSSHEGFELEMALSDIVANAIEHASFTVHYQPIWCLRDNAFHSAEALVRLDDPTFGMVPPGLFIPEAEQNGSIGEIGAILLDKVCEFLGRVDYGALGLEYVEVNLSVDQCMQPDLADGLLALAREHGVAPGRVNLEITETSSSYSQEAVAANVDALARAGFTFSLDDYGTGYSSLRRLVTLPFSLVKLDRSLVEGLDDPTMRTALADTIAMLKELGKDTLAEGVETREQADALAAMGIDYIQGYYYAKPMPEADFLAFLREQHG